MASKRKVGEVFTYFSNVGVAGVKITDGKLKVDDRILIEGRTTNIEQIVGSMQIDRNPVEEADVGQSVGIKVEEKVRPNDVVYVIESEE